MRRLLFALCLAGCAHAAPTLSGPTIEVALDDGRASERPLTPARTFEMLMRVDPQLPQFVPKRLRLLLAQAGHVVLTIYGTTADGMPGAALTTLDRLYEPAWTSTGKDGKWIVEPLELPAQRAPIWIGIHSPGGGGDPRLWASSNDTGSVFQRDADPATPLSSMRIPRTPMLRVELAPAP